MMIRVKEIRGQVGFLRKSEYLEDIWCVEGNDPGSFENATV